MNRRKFALIWGRKVFFGLAWPLFSLLGLAYFMARILPSSFGDIVYLVLTFIGHYGLISALLYFVLFVPVVLLFPGYYVSRFWSLLLIMISALALFFDSVIFALYRDHFNFFFLDLISKGAFKQVFTWRPGLFGAAGAVLLVIAVVIWIRGELLWRAMQRRFNNPTSSWYLVLIAVSLIAGHSLHYWGGQGPKKLAALFPLYWPVPFNGPAPVKDLFYPRSRLVCPGTDNRNVLLIVLDSWNSDELSPETVPSISHYASHGLRFTDHHSGGRGAPSGLFSILYSLPGTYMDSAVEGGVSPVLMNELKRRNYALGIFTDGVPAEFEKAAFGQESRALDVASQWMSWSAQHEAGLETPGPFFGLLYFSRSQGLQNIDARIYETVEDLYKRGLLSSTIVIITAETGTQHRVPLVVLWPGKSKGPAEGFTSHYDLVPSLMSGLWKCKNKITDYSQYGASLFMSRPRKRHVSGDPQGLSIIDYKGDRIIEMSRQGELSVAGQKKDKGLLLTVMRELNRFYKR